MIAVLAVASIYYGGANSGDVNLLISDYLASSPQTPSSFGALNFNATSASVVEATSAAGEGAEICARVNDAAGVTVDLSNAATDADTDGVYDALANAAFGCVATNVTAGAEVYTFQFK